MNKKQWITACCSIGLLILLYVTRDETPPLAEANVPNTGSGAAAEFNFDTILKHAKEVLTPEQLTRVSLMEKDITRGDVQEQRIHSFHQLSRFWLDTARQFLPFIGYRAEAARLENSEKNLTFAAHLLLDSLREEPNVMVKKWEALEAKDLFERSLKINPKNDSAQVGLGACYLFGGISDMPMEGIRLIREVTERDSNNVFAQMTLGYGSLISGQYEKGVDRFEKVLQIDAGNREAVLMLVRVGEEYEQQGEHPKALSTYRKALPYIDRADWKTVLQERIDQLKK